MDVGIHENSTAKVHKWTGQTRSYSKRIWTSPTIVAAGCFAIDVALVSRFRGDEDPIDSGSAYVFRFDGNQWTEEQKLTPSDGAAGDDFGHSVAVLDNIALIGAFLDDDNGSNSGSAYLFRFDGSQWIEEQKLIASDGAFRDYFGRSVTMSDDVALIGAPGGWETDEKPGSAYVFNLETNCSLNR